eukprot:scaffold353_cov185-Amphora_coffeaeformis.AAC.38
MFWLGNDLLTPGEEFLYTFLAEPRPVKRLASRPTNKKQQMQEAERARSVQPGRRAPNLQLHILKESYYRFNESLWHNMQEMRPRDGRQVFSVLKAMWK